MTPGQRRLLEHILEQRDLEPIVATASDELIVDEDMSAEEADKLINALLKAADNEHVDYRVGGIIGD